MVCCYKYILIRRQFIDPFRPEQGLYKNEFTFLTSFPSLKEIKKEVRRLQRNEGKISKYKFGYITTTDLTSIEKE